MEIPDWITLCNSFPTPSLLLKCDAPFFTVSHVNDAAEKILGAQAKCLVEKKISDGLDQCLSNGKIEGIPALLSELDQIVESKQGRTGKILKYTSARLGKDNPHVSYWELTGAPLFKPSGEINAILLTLTDVTIKEIINENGKNLLSEYVKNQQQYRSLFDFNPEAIYSFDLNGDFVSANIAAIELSEVPLEDLLGMNFFRLIVPEELNKVKSHFKKAAEGIAQSYTTEISTLRGNRKILEVTNLPIIVNSKIIGVYGIAEDITEKLGLLKELEKSRDELQKIIDYSLDMICTFDRKGCFTRVGAGSERVLGYKPGELIGKHYSSLILPEDLKTSIEAEANIKNGIGVTTFENRFKRKNGSIVYLLWSARWDEDNQLMYCVAKDASDLHKIRKELKEFSKRIANILDSITDSFFAVNNEWIITYWNRNAELGVGINREEIIGRNLWEMFPEATAIKFYSEFHRAVREKTSVHFEEFYPPLSSWYDVSAYPSDSGLAVYYKDITERKNIEEGIRIAKERYDLVAKATADVIWDWDLLRDKIIWNNSLEKNFGYTSLESNVALWTENIHPEDKERVISGIYKCIEELKENWTDEYRFKCKDGTYRDICDRGFLIFDNEHKAIRMIGVMEDITSRKQYIKAIEDQNVKLKEIARIHSHVVRAPLARLMGLIGVLQLYDYQKPDKVIMDNILTSAQEFDSIIKEIVKNTEVVYNLNEESRQ